MIRSLFFAAPAMLAGVLLLAMGVPRFDSALARLAPAAVAGRLADGEKVEGREILRAVDRLESDLRRHPDGAGRSKLAYLSFHHALQVGVETPRGDELLAESMSRQIAALAARPLDGFGWFRLAQAALLYEGAGEAAIDYLDMSLEVYPAAGQMLMARLDMGLLLWPQLPDATRDKLRPQIRLAAAGDFRRKREFVRIIRQRFALAPVRASLRGNPQLAADFERFYQTWYWR